MSEVEPEAGADGGFDLGARLLGDERGVADEEGGVGVDEHGDGVGGRGEKLRCCADELLEEDLGVGERAAGCGVGCDGADGGEGAVDEGEVGGALLPHLFEMWGTRCLWPSQLDNELDGADCIQRGDGAVGDDGQLGGERGDGDEAEIGAAGEEFFGAEGGLGGVNLVAGGEGGGER